MSSRSGGGLVGRLAVGLAIVVGIGLVAELVGELLRPITPSWLGGFAAIGASKLQALLTPALPAAAALALLWAGWWLLRRR